VSSTKLFFRHFTLGLLAVTLTFNAHVLVADEDDGPAFTVGSQAPPIDIEHWMSDGSGKFEHTTTLEADKVYVIEFWATWCGPCIGSMPHLAEIQKKFADQGVQIISISDEDLETVEKFLEKDVRGEEDQTYGELTSDYSLTTDPDGSVYDDYFKAAGLSGIPSAFIVGKTGLVEWIGHPMEMDKPLSQVVKDEWDRDAFLVELKKEQEIERVMRKLSKSMRVVQTKLRSGDSEAALELLDELIANEEYESAAPKLKSFRQQMVILYVGGEAAVTELKALGEANKNDPELLNQIAWSVYESQLENGVDESVLNAAIEVAELAVQGAPENGSVLDTLAHLLHASGNLDRAIEVQQEAVKHAGQMIGEIQPFLDELNAEKNSPQEKEPEETP
jgi:thiol-disulfide isomerase/thioredoxin